MEHEFSTPQKKPFGVILSLKDTDLSGCRTKYSFTFLSSKYTVTLNSKKSTESTEGSYYSIEK